MSRNSKHAETRCIHAGNTVDPETGAVMPAIYTSSTFENAGLRRTAGVRLLTGR